MTAPAQHPPEQERQRTPLEAALHTVREAYLGNPAAIEECSSALAFLEEKVPALASEHQQALEALRVLDRYLLPDMEPDDANKVSAALVVARDA